MPKTQIARAPALESLRVNVIVGRAHARLSQDELARRAAVSRPTISRIERGVGDVSIDVVQRLADALNLTVADLFVQPRSARVDDDELVRRAADSDGEFGDARTLLGAIEEAAEASVDELRYSRAGRPPVAR